MSIAHFQQSCQALITMAVEALTSSPHLTPAQRKIHGEAVVCAIMAFLPTEPLQVMLASQAAGHHFGVLDTFTQILNRSLADGISVKMRTISIGETRMTLALVRELRRVRKEMIAEAKAERDTMEVHQDAVPERPAEVPPAAKPATATPTSDRPAEAPPASKPPAAPTPATQMPSLAEVRHAAETIGDIALAAHIADFENALIAMEQTLEEARAPDKPAAAVNGHLAAAAPRGSTAAERQNQRR